MKSNESTAAHIYGEVTSPDTLGRCFQPLEFEAVVQATVGQVDNAVGGLDDIGVSARLGVCLVEPEKMMMAAAEHASTGPTGRDQFAHGPRLALIIRNGRVQPVAGILA